MNFYQRYKTLCEEHDESMSAVATKLGLNKSTVTFWKNNNSTPKIDTLNKIANYFNISVDDLIKSTNDFDTKKDLPADDGKQALIKDIVNDINNLSDEEVLRLKTIMRAAFPDKFRD